MAGLTQFTNTGFQEVSHFLIVFPSTWIWFQGSVPAGIQVSVITWLLSPMTSNTREVFMPVTPTLINCLSLRCLWILLSNPAWELGITFQAGNLESEQFRATQSHCFHFSQTYPSLTLCLQVSRGSLISKAPTPPLSAYILGFEPSENKSGSVTFKEFLFPALHNLETRTQKGQGNVLGISWGWRTQKMLSFPQWFNNHSWKMCPNN